MGVRCNVKVIRKRSWWKGIFVINLRYIVLHIYTLTPLYTEVASWNMYMYEHGYRIEGQLACHVYPINDTFMPTISLRCRINTKIVFTMLWLVAYVCLPPAMLYSHRPLIDSNSLTWSNSNIYLPDQHNAYTRTADVFAGQTICRWMPWIPIETEARLTLHVKYSRMMNRNYQPA